MAEPRVWSLDDLTEIAKYMAALDEKRKLGALFAGNPALNACQRRIVEHEEAWILGVSKAGTRSGVIDVDISDLLSY